jgi:hypothetical protein
MHDRHDVICVVYRTRMVLLALWTVKATVLLWVRLRMSQAMLSLTAYQAHSLWSGTHEYICTCIYILMLKTW